MGCGPWPAVLLVEVSLFKEARRRRAPRSLLSKQLKAPPIIVIWRNDPPVVGAPALVVDAAHTMIYRPAPMTELKAQTIEAIIKSEIMEVRRQRRDEQDTSFTITRTFLPSLDGGLEAGQGRRQAIKRRLEELRRERDALAREEINLVQEKPGRPTSPNEIDVMEP